MDLTDAYENAKYIPNAADYPPKWATAAAAFRSSLGIRALVDLPYGAKDRNRFDLFVPEGSPVGLLVFVHGGYWLKFDKSTWSHLAAGPLAHGWAVAMPSYSLAPEVRVAQITKEIAQAVGSAAGRVAGPIVVTGHSAGGHLSARMRCAGVLDTAVAARVHRVVPISPVADLRPLMQTAMNTDLAISPAEATSESPMLCTDLLDAQTVVWVGAAERPSFLDQARWLSQAWHCGMHIAESKHHFDVIEEMAQPQSALTLALVRGAIPNS